MRAKTYQEDRITLHHADCMDVMAQYPDKYFDLAVVDPPYGIGIDGRSEQIKEGQQIRKAHEFKAWDVAIPNATYFAELKRVSKDQVIWGGNYFTDHLPPVKGWIFWYKAQQGLTMSDGEMAWTSTKSVTRMVTMHRTHIWKEKPQHPTQKPVKLYDWIYANYAKPGMKIIDTHLGSGSNAIAAHYAGMEFVGCELDADYYEAACKRVYHETRQQELF